VSEFQGAGFLTNRDEAIMNYSKAIRVARSLADISQGELADRAEIDRSYLSLIESGKRKPSVEIIEKIASALKLPFHLLSLLGSEKADVREASEEQIEGLSLALTKLLLEVSDDKLGEGKREQRRSLTSADRKPARSRISSGRRSRDASRSRKQLAR
jgi:transcriptional regulator with XRE-family HTH domain